MTAPVSSPGRPRKRLRFMRGDARHRPFLDFAEPSIDSDGTFNIGNGTATPWQYLPVNRGVEAGASVIAGMLYSPSLLTTTGGPVGFRLDVPGVTFTQYPIGLRIVFIAHATNGANATLSINTSIPAPFGSKTGAALPSSTLIADGLHEVFFDGDFFRLLS